jgi:hypothetical protein
VQHDRSQGCEARSAKNSSHYPFSRSGRLCTFGQIERGTPAFSAFLMHTRESASTVHGRSAPRAVGFSQVASPAKRSKSTPLESNVCSGRRYGSRGRQTTASEPRKMVIRCRRSRVAASGCEPVAQPQLVDWQQLGRICQSGKRADHRKVYGGFTLIPDSGGLLSERRETAPKLPGPTEEA